MLNRDDKRKKSEWKARGNPVEKGFISFSFQLFSLSCLCYSVRLLCCVVCCNTSRNTIGVVLGWVFFVIKRKEKGGWLGEQRKSTIICSRLYWSVILVLENPISCPDSLATSFASNPSPPLESNSLLALFRSFFSSRSDQEMSGILLWFPTPRSHHCAYLAITFACLHSPYFYFSDVGVYFNLIACIYFLWWKWSGYAYA